MKNITLIVTAWAFSAILVTAPVFGAQMSREFRNGSGVDITRLVTPHYTSCTPDVHKDEKGSLAFRGSKGSKCYTYKGDVDHKGMFRDHR